MNTTSSDIFHKGRIVSITPELISVEIVSEDACSSCHAKEFCSAGSEKTRLVEVQSVPGYGLGEEVNLVMKRSMGMKAVWIAYVIPLIVLVLSILAFFESGVPETLSGLLGLGLVAVYYFVVFLFRNRLKNEYSFIIRKI